MQMCGTCVVHVWYMCGTCVVHKWYMCGTGTCVVHRMYVYVAILRDNIIGVFS